MTACARSGFTSSAPPPTSSSTTSPTSTRPPARSGSRWRRAESTSSTPACAVASRDRCRHPSCRPSRAGRWPASSTWWATASTPPGSAAGWSHTSGWCPGGYAEQAVTTPTDLLFPVPDHVDLADAVAMVGTGRTAQGILELEPPTSGDTVLVPAAAGGLGWLLVQAGTRRVPASSPPPGARTSWRGSRSWSPDLVVDYSDDDWADAVRREVGGVSLVYDGVGGAVGRSSLELLSPGGRHVMFGYSAGSPTRFETADVVSGGISVSWSLGAADGRAARWHPRPGRPCAGAARGRRVAAAGHDVPAGRGRPRARRPGGPGHASARSSCSPSTSSGRLVPKRPRRCAEGSVRRTTSSSSSRLPGVHGDSERLVGGTGGPRCTRGTSRVGTGWSTCQRARGRPRPARPASGTSPGSQQPGRGGTA